MSEPRRTSSNTQVGNFIWDSQRGAWVRSLYGPSPIRSPSDREAVRLGYPPNTNVRYDQSGNMLPYRPSKQELIDSYKSQASLKPYNWFRWY